MAKPGSAQKACFRWIAGIARQDICEAGKVRVRRAQNIGCIEQVEQLAAEFQSTFTAEFELFRQMQIEGLEPIIKASVVAHQRQQRSVDSSAGVDLAEEAV